MTRLAGNILFKENYPPPPLLGLVYQIQNAPVKQGDNAPNASKCSKPMKGM